MHANCTILREVKATKCCFFSTVHANCTVQQNAASSLLCMLIALFKTVQLACTVEKKQHFAAFTSPAYYNNS
jgi:hypothetical protein